MLNFKMPACFENVVEADEVTLNVGIRVRDGIANASLGREVHDHREMILLEQIVNFHFVREVRFDESPFFASRGCECFDFFEAFVLDVHVVVVGDGIKPDEFCAVVIAQQLLAEIATDKACGPRDENGFPVEINVLVQHDFSLASKP